ncbi:MAG: TrmH family RNA methyltransferase [Flavobacteriaceae bacterium]
MGRLKIIDSIKNRTVKEVVLVKEKSRWRKKTGQFVVEGKREIEMALKGGYTLTKIFFDPGIISIDSVQELLSTYVSGPEIIEVSHDVYRRIAYRDKTEGIVALGVSKQHLLEDLEFKRKAPLVLVAEGLEKPGNMGALLRTADAASLDAVIIANPKTDLYNPNVIRSSLGCVFSVPVAQAGNAEVMEFLTSRKILIIAAELGAVNTYSAMDFTVPAAIVVGAESTGLTDLWIDNASHRVIIPMQGEIDSMNVSVSAAILIFEAMRQRNFK